MNYLAHGRQHLQQDPYFLAGTAAPDWMNVVARRSKLRRASCILEDADAQAAAFARGVVQHHQDDQWFHQTRAFVELSLKLSAAIRDCTAQDPGMRPSFVGHVLVEMLLDAELIRRCPAVADQYYNVLHQVDAGRIEDYARRIASGPVTGLRLFLPAFLRERFLYDYREDATLLRRVNHVLRRVGLKLLPGEAVQVVAIGRRQVREQTDALLDRGQ